MGTDPCITIEMGTERLITIEMGTDPRITIEVGTSPRAPSAAILARTVNAPPFRQSPQASPFRQSPQALRNHAALSGGERTMRQWWARVSVPANCCAMIFLNFLLLYFYYYQ